MEQPPLNRLLELQSFLLHFHKIERVVYFPDSTKRRETDTEHAYSLAMAAWFLAQYFKELDRDLIIKLALVHDLVEIYAGDTYIYADQAELDTKAQREAEAMKQIKHEWPDFGDMTQLIEAYEKRQTPESCFVYALDKLMPIFMIFLGHGYTWKEEKITLEQLQANKEPKVSSSPEIHHYYGELVELLKSHRHYFASTE